MEWDVVNVAVFSGIFSKAKVSLGNMVSQNRNLTTCCAATGLSSGDLTWMGKG